MCLRWKESFEAFLRDVGNRPAPNLTIDRIDNDRGYEPGNVRWATQLEQVRNYSGNKLIQCGGKAVPLSVAAELTGIPANVIAKRLRHGWSEKDAITRPLSKSHQRAGKQSQRKRRAV